MKTKQFERMVADDAHRMLMADMFYGEGAGTRRKLIRAEVNQKIVDHADQNYFDRLMAVYYALDEHKYAKMAMKEREKIDRAVKAGKNFNALKTGNYQRLSNGVYLVVLGGFALHWSGYDQVIAEKAKAEYVHLRRVIEQKRRDREAARA